MKFFTPTVSVMCFLKKPDVYIFFVIILYISSSSTSLYISGSIYSNRKALAA